MGRIGRYIKEKWRVDARLGDGATATVYAATHRNGHRVALKVLHPHLSRNEQVRKRFLREGYVANAIQHPGIVRVLDDDVTEDGAAFLVMELLEGESLDRRAQRMGGRLPLGEVLIAMDKLLDVLAAAHAVDVVHRDVKPENVFLTRDGVIKVLDFGLARIKAEASLGALGDSSREWTKTGFVMGTPDFMSPEQAAGSNKGVDARADIWSVGATAFVLISNKAVHGDTTTLEHHLVTTATMRPRSLASVAAHVPPAIVAVIDRALELEKERRWPTARAMQLALRRAQGMRVDEPVDDDEPTRPPSTQHGTPRPPRTVEVPSLVELDPSLREELEDPDGDGDATVPFMVSDPDLTVPRPGSTNPMSARPAAGAPPPSSGAEGRGDRATPTRFDLGKRNTGSQPHATPGLLAQAGHAGQQGQPVRADLAETEIAPPGSFRGAPTPLSFEEQPPLEDSLVFVGARQHPGGPPPGFAPLPAQQAAFLQQQQHHAQLAHAQHMHGQSPYAAGAPPGAYPGVAGYGGQPPGAMMHGPPPGAFPMPGPPGAMGHGQGQAQGQGPATSAFAALLASPRFGRWLLAAMVGVVLAFAVLALLITARLTKGATTPGTQRAPAADHR